MKISGKAIGSVIALILAVGAALGFSHAEEIKAEICKVSE